MIKKRRYVTLSNINKDGRKHGGRWKVYGYTKRDLALLFNVTIPTLRNMISAKLLDPTNLESIVKLWHTRHQ
jgi:hypothetical protein